MKTATVRHNAQFNGIEITFNSKPAAATLAALKAGGFRWHRSGGYWYAKATEARERLAAEIAADGQTVESTPAPVKAERKPAQDQNRIKIYYNGLRLGEERAFVKCGYYKDCDSDSITIYADGYGADLPRDLFEVKNDTDIYTDYFDNDRATVTPAHPLYKYIKYAQYKAEAREVARLAEYYEKRAKKYANDPSAADWYIKSAKETRARLAKLEAIADPGQPTAEDLAKIDRARQEAENKRREEEHAAQLARREEVLNQRHAGRVYVEKVAEAYPIEDGAPVVEIGFSENPAFYSWTDSIDKTRTEIIINADGSQEGHTEIIEPRRRCLLSVTAADIVLKHFDEIVAGECRGYDKTDFYITWTDESGEPWKYEGRYDLGDRDGGLVAHVEQLAKWDATHDRHGHPTTDPQKIDTGRAAWVELLKKYRRAQ